MRLVYWDMAQAYVALSAFTERAIPKDAGFVWNTIVRRQWATQDPNVARVLVKYATAECKAQLTRDAARARLVYAQSKAVSSTADFPHPPGLEYLPFQKAGIEFMLVRPSALCADDMGLGKTIETIGVLNADPTLQSILIVTKAVLKLNWYRELRKWRTRKMSVGVCWGEHLNLPNTNVVVINYDLLDRHATAGLRNRKWDCIVLDEGHYLKNPKKKRTRAVFGFTDKKRNFTLEPLQARRKIILTGTPAENYPKELYPLLHWLDPVAWPSWFQYARRYCDPFHNGFGWVYKGASNLPELRNRLRSTLMIRREFDEVFPELPPVRYQIIEMPVSDGATKKLVSRELSSYNQLVESGASPEVAFKEISKVRHELGLVKRPLIQSYLEELREESSRKFIVFAHHQDVLDSLYQAFPDSVLVRGGLSDVSRQVSVDKFQNDTRCRVFFGSIRAASEGLNLFAGSHVIFGEFDWTPGRMVQAVGRAHRMGQTDRVLVTYLVLQGSLDLKLVETFVEKHSTLREVYGDKKEII